MQSIHLYLSRQQGSRVIDITPLPWWRRAARASMLLLVPLVVVPLVWLVCAIVATAILVGCVAMLAHAALRPGERQAPGTVALRGDTGRPR